LIFFPWIITNWTKISDSVAASKCGIWYHDHNKASSKQQSL